MMILLLVPVKQHTRSASLMYPGVLCYKECLLGPCRGRSPLQRLMRMDTVEGKVAQREEGRRQDSGLVWILETFLSQRVAVVQTPSKHTRTQPT